MRLPVLMYHHVGPLRAGIRPIQTVSPARFEAQIRWLVHRGFTSIVTADWIAWCNSSGTMPRRPVLITFDDGYADIAEFALPVLRRHGLNAVVFLVTDYIGKTNLWEGMVGRGKLQLLNEKQIREWHARGIEFGSHSRTHPDLRGLSLEELRTEILGSASDLELLLNERPKAFAYPYGRLNNAVREQVDQEFEIAMTSAEGCNSSPSDSRLMRRLEILPVDNLFSFQLLIKLGFRVSRRIRLYHRFPSIIRRILHRTSI